MDYLAEKIIHYMEDDPRLRYLDYREVGRILSKGNYYETYLIFKKYKKGTNGSWILEGYSELPDKDQGRTLNKWDLNNNYPNTQKIEGTLYRYENVEYNNLEEYFKTSAYQHLTYLRKKGFIAVTFLNGNDIFLPYDQPKRKL